jgi:hypothetical protein
MGSENNISAPNAGIDARRTDDFTSRYANNVQFEPTLWDLKLVFGQTDQKVGPMTVLQHSAITLSWPEVKVLIYFLRSHLAGHEAQVGVIPLMSGIVFPPSEEMPPGLAATHHEVWKKALDAMNKVFHEFVQENPSAATISLAKSKR